MPSIFSEQLTERQNQIDVYKPVSSEHPMKTILEGVSSIGGTILANSKDDDDEDRAELMGNVSDTLKDLAHAREQGSFGEGAIAEDRYNLLVDKTLRDVLKRNPTRTDDINKWVREDLGIRPQGNELEGINARQQAIENERASMLGFAEKYGLKVRDANGKVNVDATISQVQDYNGAVMQAQLAAAKDKGQSFTEQQERQAVDVRSSLLNAADIAFKARIHTVIENAQAAPDDLSKRTAALAEFDKAVLDFKVNVMDQIKLASPMKQDLWNGIEEGIAQDFKTKRDAIFGTEDKPGTWENARLTADMLVKEQSTSQKLALPELFALKGPLGEEVGRGIAQSLIGSEKMRKFKQDKADDLVNLLTVKKTFESGTKGTVDTGSISPEARTMTAAAANAGLDNVLKKETLGEDDMNGLISSTATILDLSKTSKSGYDQLQGLFKKASSKPEWFTKLDSAQGNQKTSVAAKTVLSDLTKTSRGYLEKRNPSFKAEEEDWSDKGALGRIEYDADTGQVTFSLKERKSKWDAGSKFSDRAQTGLKGLSQRVNEVLNVYGMSRGTLDKSFSTDEYKLDMVRKLGIPVVGLRSTKATLDIPGDAPATGPKKRPVMGIDPATGELIQIGEE